MSKRNIVLIPVDREDNNRIAAIYELSKSDRADYRFWREHVRMGHPECEMLITTTDRLHELKTRVEPYVGTYLEAK